MAAKRHVAARWPTAGAVAAAVDVDAPPAPASAGKCSVAPH